MAQAGWWSRHWVTLIALATGLAIAAVVAWFAVLSPFWKSPQANAPGASESTNRSAAGWEIRYNATLALARRGSKEVPLDVLQEMLDEDLQLHNFEVRMQSGQVSVDEQAARTTVLKALEAAIALHQKQPELELARLEGALEKLTHSSNLTLREKAGQAREELAKKG